MKTKKDTRRYAFINGDYIEVEINCDDGKLEINNGASSKVLLPKKIIDALLQFIEHQPPDSIGDEFESIELPCCCDDFHCDAMFVIHSNGYIIIRDDKWRGVNITPYCTNLLRLAIEANEPA